ncbi:MAG: alanine racemase [Myxococcota bacterium]
MVLTPPRRPTSAHVDVDALHHNVELIGRHTGRPIMAIVKANAYGHGLVPTSRIFVEAGVAQLGVAFLEEGLALRKAGLGCPILVLGGIIGNQIEAFIENDLSMTASSVHKLRQIDDCALRLGRRARVHLKVDTGMGRFGMQWDSCEALLQAAGSTRSCQIEGLYSHLAASEEPDPSFTQLQGTRFERIRSLLPDVPGHLANSGAVLAHPETWYDMVRPGLALYGVAPSPRLQEVLDLRPALSLRTRVVYFKVVRQGRTVSYDRTWISPVDTRVVTLPVGYGDGYDRRLSNRAQVVIRGRRHALVGRVTMDAVMIDLGPEGEAYNEDEVHLIGGPGPQAISIAEMAAWMDAIPYEVLTNISPRVPRVYERDGVEVPMPGPPASAPD